MSRMEVPQAGVVPYRVRDDRIEVCLVTSVATGQWIFPKGTIDPGETSRESALKEAHEEAGLAGVIQGDPLGSYTYEKRGARYRVQVFLMRVDETAEDWLEARKRRRVWVSLDEARAMLPFEELRQLLDRAIEQLHASGPE